MGQNRRPWGVRSFQAIGHHCEQNWSHGVWDGACIVNRSACRRSWQNSSSDFVICNEHSSPTIMHEVSGLWNLVCESVMQSHVIPFVSLALRQCRPVSGSLTVDTCSCLKFAELQRVDMGPSFRNCVALSPLRLDDGPTGKSGSATGSERQKQPNWARAANCKLREAKDRVLAG